MNNDYVFIGVEDGGYHCLEELCKHSIEPAAVFTYDESHKDSIVNFKSFKDLDQAKQPFYYVDSINSNLCVDIIRKIDPSLIVTAFCSELIDKALLSLPRYGTIGLHGTLLPKHRGRAPIPWSIIYGLKRSGMTLFYLAGKPDEGDIIAQKSYEILRGDYAIDLYDKAKRAAAELLVNYVPKLLNGEVFRKKQEVLFSDYWSKRKPEDGAIDWNKSAEHIYDWIRALSRPFPGAFSYIGNSIIRIHRSLVISHDDNYEPGKVYWDKYDRDLVVGTGEGAIVIIECDIDGKESSREIFNKMFYSKHFVNDLYLQTDQKPPGF